MIIALIIALAIVLAAALLHGKRTLEDIHFRFNAITFQMERLSDLQKDFNYLRKDVEDVDFKATATDSRLGSVERELTLVRSFVNIKSGFPGVTRKDPRGNQ